MKQPTNALSAALQYYLAQRQGMPENNVVATIDPGVDDGQGGLAPTRENWEGRYEYLHPTAPTPQYRLPLRPLPAGGARTAEAEQLMQLLYGNALRNG